MKIVERRSPFIRQFKLPRSARNAGCLPYHLLTISMGCPYSCDYCLIQAETYYRCNPDALRGLIYSNIEAMEAEVRRWLLDPVPKMLMAGEVQDTLVFDAAYERASGKAITHRVVPLFAGQDRHRLNILTKSAAIQHAILLPPTPQVVYSWSVNADEVARRWETGAPSPSVRLEAATRMKEAGWPVRIRLDPMIPIPNWREGYAKVIERINALDPEMVTLGTLRATNAKSLRSATERNGRDPTVFDFLSGEKDEDGYKNRIPRENVAELYRFALERLSSRVTPALCYESRDVWKALGLPFRGCNCILGSDDTVARCVSGAPSRCERQEIAMNNTNDNKQYDLPPFPSGYRDEGLQSELRSRAATCGLHTGTATGTAS